MAATNSSSHHHHPNRLISLQTAMEAEVQDTAIIHLHRKIHHNKVTTLAMVVDTQAPLLLSSLISRLNMPIEVPLFHLIYNSINKGVKISMPDGTDEMWKNYSNDFA